YQARAFVIPAVAVGAPHRRDRVFVVGYTEHDGSLAAKVGRSTKTSGKYGAEGKDEAGQSARASRRASDENVADTASEGLSQRRQSGFAKAEKETETGMESKSQRCGENVADTCDEWVMRRNGELPNDEESGGSGCHHNGRTQKNDGRKWRAVEPGLGGVLDGISARLDGHRWPAPLGQPQYDWEPP